MLRESPDQRLEVARAHLLGGEEAPRWRELQDRAEEVLVEELGERLLVEALAVAPALALTYPRVNLLQALGPVGGLAVTYAGLLGSFLLLVWWERRFFARAGGQRAPAVTPAAATEVLG